jgi:predicted SnoaL-like aldol condensation-catalyzing enzyme
MKQIIATIVLSVAFILPVSAQSSLTAQEEANKAVVSEFWRVVIQAGDVEKADKYYAVDMVQHNPNVPTGLAGFKEFFSSFNREVQPVKDSIGGEVLTMVEGDYVTIVRMADTPNPGGAEGTYKAFNFDTFLVKDGMIVEHWDAARKAE